MISEDIRLADTSRLVPGLSETDLIQQLVSRIIITHETTDADPATGPAVFAT
jgi:hypothetical protein